MSKKLCPLCRETVYKFPEYNIPNGLYHCGMCEKNFTNEEVLNNDLFHRITQSPEVLAEKLVYEAITCDGDGHVLSGYRSTIIQGFWLSELEAIAATVARLKEVCK